MRRNEQIEFRTHRQQIEYRNRRLAMRLGFVLGLFGGAVALSVWWWQAW